jgi:dethiobiotin synthetase
MTAYMMEHLFDDDDARTFILPLPGPSKLSREASGEDTIKSISSQATKGTIAVIPTIIIVGADKGGVGKTTICRALLDYLAERQHTYRAFDTEFPAGDLNRFAPESQVIDIGQVQAQMSVFDGVDSERLTVIDLRGGLLTPTLQALDDAKLFDDVRNNKMRLILLHVLGPTMASIAEISEAAKRIGAGSARHFVVKNHINQTQYFDWDEPSRQAVWQQMSNVTIDVPQLSEIACETLQKHGGSFAAFCADQNPAGPQSRVLRGRVRTWLEAVWREFDRVGLGELINS